MKFLRLFFIWNENSFVKYAHSHKFFRMFFVKGDVDMNWYEGICEDIVRVFDGEDFVVDYDKKRGLYRVSVFEDGHYVDEVVFLEAQQSCASQG